MASFLDKKLDFKPAIEALKRVLGILFPFSAFVKSKNDTYHVGTIFETKHGHSVVIKSERLMTRYEQMYGKIESQFALDTIKMGLKREICDEIMRSDLFEWITQETPTGTKIGARLTVSDFNSGNTNGTSGMAGNLGTSGGRSYY